LIPTGAGTSATGNTGVEVYFEPDFSIFGVKQ